METVIIVIHLMIVIAMIAVILLQRSEGGALGIGGGGGGLFSSRGSANVLTRATTILAATFFATSIGLTLIARSGLDRPSILDDTTITAPGVPVGEGVVRGSGEGLLDTLRDLSAPADAPATAPAPAPPVDPGPADTDTAPAPAGPQVPVAQ
jgi:preprotein translocase subunit SecG